MKAPDSKRRPVSAAVAHTAKSAMRGFERKRVWSTWRRPVTTPSSRPPKISPWAASKLMTYAELEVLPCGEDCPYPAGHLSVIRQKCHPGAHMEAFYHRGRMLLGCAECGSQVVMVELRREIGSAGNGKGESTSD